MQTNEPWLVYILLPTNYSFTNHICLIYMYKWGLNSLQGLISHKNQATEKCPYIFYFWIEELYIINWITMTWKSGKHCTQHAEPLDSCFELLRSHQQFIQWSPLTGDWTSNHRMQNWNSTPELLVHTAHKWCQIN